MDNGIDLGQVLLESGSGYLAPNTLVLSAGNEFTKGVELSNQTYLAQSIVIGVSGFEIFHSLGVGVDAIFLNLILIRDPMVVLHTFARPKIAGDTGQIIDVGYYVEFSASPRLAYTGDTIQFVDETYGPEVATRRWNFGNDHYGSGAYPTHVYDEPGTYSIELEVWSIDGEYGCKTKLYYITILPVLTPEELTFMNEYIDDISFRIRNPKGNRWEYYPHIQRTLQRLYWRLCKEYRLVKDSLEMDFSTLEIFVAYWTLPRWFMKLYKLDPDFNWREPDEFDPEEADTYTIDGGKIYFGGIAATDVVTMYFYSSGKKFVTKETEDLLTDETNVTEWTNRALDQALYYGACIELRQDYPGFQHDVNEYNEMKKKMADSFDSDQDKDLVLPGDPPPAPLDAYGW